MGSQKAKISKLEKGRVCSRRRQSEAKTTAVYNDRFPEFKMFVSYTFKCGWLLVFVSVVLCSSLDVVLSIYTGSARMAVFENT
jgi:hypothetical protein